MYAAIQKYRDQLGIPLELIANRNLPVYAEAEHLEVADIGKNGQQYLLTQAAAHAWQELKAAATTDSVDIFIISAFRSFERQAELIQTRLAIGRPIAEVLTVLAPPGCSEHHTGRAVDICTPGVPPALEVFEQTEAFSWLSKHANQFGFFLSFPRDNRYGYLYEPWHWCFHANPDLIHPASQVP